MIQSRNRLTDLENKLMVGGVGEGVVRVSGIDTYTLLYLRWITNKDLLYSTGNSAQYSVTTYLNGKMYN